ncbi:MAG: hypothetical protein IT320_24120 [Anaerolineae bacterium]|nr:hypothetical protein [Anaerolineae bacterium]
MHKKDEISEILAEAIGHALEATHGDMGPVVDNFLEIVDTYDLTKKLYQPTDSLKSRLQDYSRWRQGSHEENAGEIMEEIAALVFASIRGFSLVKAYRSYDGQHDLVVSGDKGSWLTFLHYIGIKRSQDGEHETILVEAKNTDDPIDNSIFTYLCYFLQNKFRNTSQLGVFFTRSGATGFAIEGQRRVSLSDARATQIIFYATSHKFVVVLDEDDIAQLNLDGAFPSLLRAKIQDIELGTGLRISFDPNNAIEKDLPPYLARHFATD